MAHFAKVEDGIVTEVLVVDNSEEHRGQEFLADDLGLGGTWVQTSYNGNFRYNYAGIGFTYDSIDDAFIAPAPCEHEELILNNEKRWECANEAHASTL